MPGVSGGTMAIILGIYDNLIVAISRYRNDIRKHTMFLAAFGIGAGLGVLLFAQAVLWLFENFKQPMMYLFIGCILGSIPALFKKSGIRAGKLGGMVWALIGFASVAALSLIPSGIFAVGDANPILSFVMLAVAGIVVAIAFILPGISTSYMLLILGIYDITLRAVSNMDIIFLLPLLIGGAVGTVGTARILENAMRKYTSATYMAIVGFVLGSLLELVKEVPYLPTGWNIPLCLILFAAGFSAVMWVSKFSD